MKHTQAFRAAQGILAAGPDFAYHSGLLQSGTPMPSNPKNKYLSEEPVNPRTLLLGGLMAAAPLAGSARLATVADGVSKKVLPNGMTVLVKEVHSAPVVAVNAWVKVGSVHELESEKGITHFI